MNKISNLLGALYKGDKDAANSAFDEVLKVKTKQALEVKKVAVASDIFNQDKKYVFYCAAAGRSALAAKAAQDMGLNPVSHLEGGFAAWKKSGNPIETKE